MLTCPYRHGPNTFALTVKGESMLPDFKDGLIIFIDPSQMPENGQYCVAKLEDSNEATNPDWPTKYIPINGNCHIVGRMIGVYMKY